VHDQDDEVYPREIEVKSDMVPVEEFLPIMMVGLQAIGITNKAIGLVRMLYPVVPSVEILEDLRGKAEAC